MTCVCFYLSRAHDILRRAHGILRSCARVISRAHEVLSISHLQTTFMYVKCILIGSLFANNIHVCKVYSDWLIMSCARLNYVYVVLHLHVVIVHSLL